MGVFILEFKEQRRFIGDLAQLFNIKDYRFVGGRAEGVRATDVTNGSGLEFTIVADRCMDLSNVSFKGVNMSFISPCGVVAPTYYDNRGIEWLRSFTAGFLTTCGLTNAGGTCTDDGEELGLHGRISNTPAEEYSVFTQLEDGVPVVKIRGKMKEARLFGHKLMVTREYSCKYGEKSFKFTDTVENFGCSEAPFMLLYHFNLGYPLLDDKSQIIIPSSFTRPRDARTEEGMNDWNKAEMPIDNYAEMCFEHTMKSKDNKSFAAIYNPTLKTGVSINFDTRVLNRFAQWKCMGTGEYVIGLEPSNCWVEGRDKERAAGTLKTIKAGETVKAQFSIEILDGDKDRDALLDRISERK